MLCPWTRRRRRGPMRCLCPSGPGAWAIVYVCLACGLLLLFGNLLLLDDGFVQLYDSTFGDEEDREGGRNNLERNKLVGHVSRQLTRTVLNGNVVDRTLTDQAILLPVAAAAALSSSDPHLRRLLIEQDTNKNVNTAQGQQTETSSSQSLQSLRHSPLPSSQSSVSLSSPASYSLMPVSPALLRQTLASTSYCPSVVNQKHLSSGWTKAVYKGLLQHPEDLNNNPENPSHHNNLTRTQEVAVKTVNTDGFDIDHCVRELGRSKEQCYSWADNKMLKEIVLLQTLQHPNVVKLLSHCVPVEGEVLEKRVSMVTELGQGVDLIMLLQMSWDDRLRLALGLTKLIHYLAHCPYGSVLLGDFRRQQFIVRAGEIKLTDVDDVNFLERPCTHHTDCHLYFSAANYTLTNTCVEGRCVGLNERQNVFNTGRHFISLLLPPEAPSSLQGQVHGLTEDFKHARAGTDELLGRMEHLVETYISGAYLQRNGNEAEDTVYTEHIEADYPGQHDYACRYSHGSRACTISVFDRKEAEFLCDVEPDCKAFVMTRERTWTGRTLIHLKNKVGSFSHNPNTTLYIRPW